MRYFLLLALLFLIGCGQKKDVVGFWQANDSPVVYEFTKEGAMRVSMGPTAVDIGSYTIKGNILELKQNPLLDPKRHSETLPLTITWTDADHFSLPSLEGSGGQQFHRITAAERDRLARVVTPGSFPPGIPAASMPTPAPGLVEATTCLSNVKQLAMASLLYSQDYDNTLPGTAPWSDQLTPYARNMSLFSCPTLEKAGQVGGYSFNSELAGVKAGAVPTPATVPLIFESLATQLNSVEAFTAFLQNPRHGETRALSYADGHAKGLKVGQ